MASICTFTQVINQFKSSTLTTTAYYSTILCMKKITESLTSWHVFANMQISKLNSLLALLWSCFLSLVLTIRWKNKIFLFVLFKLTGTKLKLQYWIHWKSYYGNKTGTEPHMLWRLVWEQHMLHLSGVLSMDWVAEKKMYLKYDSSAAKKLRSVQKAPRKYSTRRATGWRSVRLDWTLVMAYYNRVFFFFFTQS